MTLEKETAKEKVDIWSVFQETQQALHKEIFVFLDFLTIHLARDRHQGSLIWVLVHCHKEVNIHFMFLYLADCWQPGICSPSYSPPSYTQFSQLEQCSCKKVLGECSEVTGYWFKKCNEAKPRRTVLDKEHEKYLLKKNTSLLVCCLECVGTHIHKFFGNSFFLTKGKMFFKRQKVKGI